MAQEVVADLASGSGWEVVDEGTLLTPNGHEIEWDGISPDGEESILIQLGLI
jgi:C-terminal processing protease CtpA/Prc